MTFTTNWPDFNFQHQHQHQHKILGKSHCIHSIIKKILTNLFCFAAMLDLKNVTPNRNTHNPLVQSDGIGFMFRGY